MKKRKDIRWESYEDMIERREASEKKKREKKIMKLLRDPEIPDGEKDRLVEELYRDIDIMYVEPDEYFPKELRKKYKLGKFADCGGNKPVIYPPIREEDEKE